MAGFSTLITALALAQAPTMLADLAVACNDPAKLEQTKQNLLNKGWAAASDEKQAKFNAELTAMIHPDDSLKAWVTVFEKSDNPKLLLLLSNEREANGFWMRSCSLRDPENVALNNLQSVRSAFALGQSDEKDVGPAYTWELWDAKLTYMLYLDPTANGGTALIVQRYGRDN